MSDKANPAPRTAAQDSDSPHAKSNARIQAVAQSLLDQRKAELAKHASMLQTVMIGRKPLGQCSAKEVEVWARKQKRQIDLAVEVFMLLGAEDPTTSLRLLLR
jgi:hypothetical protein